MPKRMAARYPGKCLAGKPQPGLAGCPKNGAVEVGDDIVWWKDAGRSQVVHQGGCEDVFWGTEFGKVEAEQERAAFSMEYAQGVALADHVRQTRDLFGEEAAAQEEVAWEMRLGDDY